MGRGSIIDSNPHIIKNFLEQKHIDELNDWTLCNYKNSFFKDTNMSKNCNRVTTRYSKEYEFTYPEIVFKIRNNIIHALNINNINYRVPSFPYGVVNGIGFDGSDIYDHIDPVWYDGTFTFHCNIITMKPECGGILKIGSNTYDPEIGDLVCYKVSEVTHSVSEMKGNTPRNLWVFGFSINREDENLLNFYKEEYGN